MSRIVVRRVSPTGLHGFGHGRLVLDGLQPGLNVVWAPNATGKSTLARSIGLLFDPDPCEKDVLVSGEIALVPEEGDARVEERNVRAKAPRYPGFSGRGEGYVLDLVAMIQGLANDEKQALATLVGGGSNLGPQPLPAPANDVKAAQARLRELKDARAAKAGTRAHEDRLEVLQAEIAEAAQAGEAVRDLDALLERRRLRSHRATLLAQCAEIEAEHPGIARQEPGAVERARDHEAALAGAVATRERAEAGLRQISPTLVFPPHALRRLDADRLERAVADVREARTKAGERAASRDRTLRNAVLARGVVLRLTPDESPEALPMPTAADVAALRDAAESDARAREARLRIDATRRAADAWRGAYPDDERDLDAPLADLREWLAATPEPARDPRPVLVFAALVLAALAGALPLPLPAHRVLALLAVAFGGHAAFVRRPLAATDRRSGIVARLVPGLIPEGASSGAVVDALRGLLLRGARREVAARLDALAGEAPPLSDWEAVAARLRLVADPLCLAKIATAMLDYHTEIRAFDEATQAHAEATAAIAESEARVACVLGAYGFPVPESRPDEATPAFCAWFDLASDLGTARAAEAARQDALRELLEGHGADASSTLLERVEGVARRAALLGDLAEVERDLAKIVPASEAFEERPDDALEARRDAKRALAERYGELMQAKGATEAAIAKAESEACLPAHEAAYEAAMDALEAKRGEIARRVVGNGLRAHLAQRQRENLPPIVRAANAYLARFSGGRYTLALEGTAEAKLGYLVVCDAEWGGTHRFDDLSLGTKVHLVVALRLGLIEERERADNRRFPLVVDEAMAVSDPQARAALARTLIEVAETRQVVVFTNGPADLATFRAAAGERPLAYPLHEASLGHVAPVVPAHAEPLAYAPPPGPARLDLRLAVGAHAGAILGNGVGAPTVSQAMRSLSACEVRFVEALEALRRGYAGRHPHFDWEHVADQGWATGTKRDDVRRLIDASRGCAHRFLVRFRQVPRVGPAMLTQARDHFQEKGFLWARPTLDQLWTEARDAFGPEACPGHVERAVALLDEAFE